MDWKQKIKPEIDGLIGAHAKEPAEFEVLTGERRPQYQDILSECTSLQGGVV